MTTRTCVRHMNLRSLARDFAALETVNHVPLREEDVPKLKFHRTEPFFYWPVNGCVCRYPVMSLLCPLRCSNCCVRSASTRLVCYSRERGRERGRAMEPPKEALTPLYQVQYAHTDRSVEVHSTLRYSTMSLLLNSFFVSGAKLLPTYGLTQVLRY